MQKRSLIMIALLLAASACRSSQDDEKSDPQPAPNQPTAPVPPPTPDPNAFKLKPVMKPWTDLHETAGFTAVYETQNPFLSLVTKGPMTVLAKPSRVQVRIAGVTEILDCVFDSPQAAPHVIKHIVNGEEKAVDTWNVLACVTIHERLRPVQNVDELCREYQCRDEVVGPFNSTFVNYSGGLWLEKDTGLVIREGANLIMTNKKDGAPDESDFDWTQAPAAL